MTSPSPETVRPAPPAEPIIVIDPHAVLAYGQLRRLFGLRESSLRREIREHRLTVRKRCGRYFFLGADVLDWLRGGVYTPKGVSADDHQRNGDVVE